jgi:hypothetical protein
MKYSIIFQNRINKVLLNRNYPPFIINNIIIPHGITDISHSLHTNNFKNLICINICSYFCIDIFSKMELNILLNFLFFYFSIIHFKNDFIIIKKKKIISTLFVMSLLFINRLFPFFIEIDIFLLYMSFIHVPLHYKKNWFHIRKKLLFNICSIFLTSIISNIMFDKILLEKNHYLFKFIISIIISHIIYNEKYL